MAMSMRKTSVAVGGFVMMTAFATAPASAQSSGNFAASVATAQCTVNDSTGALGGGISGTLLETTIKTPNSGGTALVIRPSLVTGLFTKSKTTATNPTATAVAGVKVRVLLDGKAVAPGSPVGSTLAEDGWIYFDKRFQQLSTNIFDQVDTCGSTARTSAQRAHPARFLRTVSLVLERAEGTKAQGGVKLEAQTANEAAWVGPGVLTVRR